MSNLEQICSAEVGFGLDMYNELSKASPDSNVFFSPLSLLLALAMTLLGSQNKTATEIKSVLHFSSMPDSLIHQSLMELQNMLRTGQHAFDIANKFYGEQSYSYSTDFTRSCSKFYKSGLQPVDFKNKALECESMINRWVESQTNNKIKNLIQQGSLNFQTRFVLVNALYFKAFWDSKFQRSKTREDDFTVSKDHIVRIPFLYEDPRSKKYYFHTDLNSQVLELPFKGKAASLIVILPDLTKTTMSQVESKLSGDLLYKISDHFQNYLVTLWLPKFKLETKPDVTDGFKKLGVNDAFLQNKADLSKISGDRSLYLSNIVHKAFIELDEDGVEAAAATAVHLMGSAGPGRYEPPRVDFKADHPFIFLIKDNHSKTVLFMGKLVNPK